MPKVIYIEAAEHGGKRHELDASVGQSVMEVAVRNGVPGIEAVCGGSCACATCHVYVDPLWFERVGHPSPMEAGTIEFAIDAEGTSRLSCQIKITPELDGLTVRLPKSQT
jgi:2Fe-2S ferredoxin